MTREQAQKRAQKLWGKRAAIRADGDLSSPEKREAAMARRDQIKAQQAEIDEEIKRREEAAGIPELRRQWSELGKPRTQAMSDAMHYRFSVGFIDNVIGAFNIEGQGDTWEEAFGVVERKKAS